MKPPMVEAVEDINTLNKPEISILLTRRKTNRIILLIKGKNVTTIPPSPVGPRPPSNPLEIFSGQVRALPWTMCPCRRLFPPILPRPTCIAQGGGSRDLRLVLGF
jgi:hypothetical protein